MSIEKKIQALVKSGHELEQEILNEDLLKSIEGQNPWFIQRFVKYATQSICTHYLQHEKLDDFCRFYHLKSPVNKTLALIFAGNIPLSGMHDFICGYLSGCRMQIKLSGKDNILFPLFFRAMARYDSAFHEQVKVVDKVSGFDCIMATGSDTTFPYFEQYFSTYPHILRRNRNSLAVLAGNESDKELEELADDIFLYFGLGCRNVSQLLVPSDYDLKRLISKMSSYQWVHHHTRYMNNYDYHRTLLLLNQVPHLADQHIMLTENERIQSPISVLHIKRYTTPQEITAHITANTEKIQCVVSANLLPGIKSISPGTSQIPGLTDFADDRDTIQFLLSL